MDIKVVRYSLKVWFRQEVLGTAPLRPQVYTDYITAKGEAALKSTRNGTTSKPEAIAAEVDLVAEGEKGRTGFRRDEKGRPVVPDYAIKGMFKEFCAARREHPRTLSSKLVAYKTKINNHLYVFPRWIPLIVPSGSGGEFLVERPLRAETAMGPRVALASSEAVPAGTRLECQIHVLAPDIITEDLLNEWLWLGKFKGFGQWRSGGNGRFEKYTLTRFVE